MSNRDTASALRLYWKPLYERVGLVLLDGTIVELKNESPTPDKTLWVPRQMIDEFGAAAEATWHTHPRNNVNLSPDDWRMFQSLPELKHFIVTETRVRLFSVRNGKVMLDEADCV